jgi:hypothetical protein
MEVVADSKYWSANASFSARRRGAVHLLALEVLEEMGILPGDDRKYVYGRNYRRRLCK